MKKHSSALQKPARRKRPADQPAPTACSTVSAPPAGGFSTRLEVITIPPSSTSEPPRITAPVELRPIRFGYFQPDANEVFLVGSFNGWNPRATPYKRDSLGDWSVELSLPPGEYHYRLMVDGQWRDDPMAQQTAMNPYGGFDAVIVV